MEEFPSGYVQTVLGPIKPDQLGTVLCHEHLHHKASTKLFTKNPNNNKFSESLNSTPVSVKNRWYTSYHPHTHENNLDFTSNEIQAAVLEELNFFKQNGGDTIVEVTTFGKNPQKLVSLSKNSGVHIVSNTGFYLKDAFPDSITNQSIEELYKNMKEEFLFGSDGIKPGVIGELGSSWPIFAFEKNVLIAAAQLQAELKLPVIIHPGRNAEAPFEIMRIFTEAGGLPSKTIMSHLERTLTLEQLLEFAKTGAICELDLFGNEISYYEIAETFDMPNDASRIEMIKVLIEEGYGEKIAISHDIHTKHRLMSFGGHGYSHILLNVIPKMLKKGIDQKQIDRMMIETPRRWLTLKNI